MTRSEQVIAAIVGAIIAGGMALVGVILTDSSPHDGTPGPTVINSIDNSTVNQYYSGGPSTGEPSPGASKTSCSEPKRTVGTGTLMVRIEQKAPGTPCWSAELAPVSAGTTIRYLITYQNLTRAIQRNVIIRVSLPPKMSLVPNSTYISNSTYPKGLLAPTNNVINGGVIIGSYGSGAGAYVILSVAVPFDRDLTCGWNKFNAVGVAHPKGLNEFYNTSEIQVEKNC
jgi:uncharacterized repeat protein (TIGR01451 family)